MLDVPVHSHTNLLWKKVSPLRLKICTFLQVQIQSCFNEISLQEMTTLSICSTVAVFRLSVRYMFIGPISLWRNSLETVTRLLPPATPTLVATSIQSCLLFFFLDFGGDLASSSIECPSKNHRIES